MNNLKCQETPSQTQGTKDDGTVFWAGRGGGILFFLVVTGLSQDVLPTIKIKHFENLTQPNKNTK